MGAVVIDTSVLIGFINPDDGHHHATVRALHAAGERGDQFVLPATVLSELLVRRIRRQPASARTFQDDVIEGFGPVRPVDEGVASAAAELRAKHRSLRLPDALVIATGIVDGGVVLTCDARWAAVDRRVRVVESA